MVPVKMEIDVLVLGGGSAGLQRHGGAGGWRFGNIDL